MPQLQKSTVDTFRGLDEASRRAALGRMSDAAKRALLDALKSTPTTLRAPAPPTSPELDVIKARQAEKYPTSAEQGGRVGAKIEPQRSMVEGVPAFLGGTLGGMGGAVVGGLAGAPLGPAGVIGGGYMGAVTGAGLGAGLTETLRQSFESGPMPDLRNIDVSRIKEEALVNAGGEAIGGVVGPAVSKGITKLRGPLAQGAEAAAKYAQRAGIPIDRATATGSRFLEGIRAGVDNLPLVGRRGTGFRTGQNEALQSEFGNIMERTSPGGTGDAVAVGEKIKDVLPQLKGEGSAAYEEFKAIANSPKHAARVVVPHPAGGGLGLGTTKVIQAPVDVKAAKQALTPLLEKLEQETKVAQTAASPGLGALRNFMAMDDVIPAEQAIAELSAIQDLARVSASEPAMRNVGEGIAAQVVPKFRAALDAAADKLGPEAKAALEKGRELTRQRYALFETFHTTEPAKIVGRLMEGGDLNLERLRTLAKVAPAEVPNVGRAYLQKVFTDAGKDGGFHPGRAFTQWAKLGPETKKLLFTPDRAKEIGEFMDLAKRISRGPNSDTARTVVSLGAGGLLFGGGDFGEGVKREGKLLITGEILSRMLYSKRGAGVLRSGMLAKAGGAVSKSIAKAIAVEYQKAKNAEQQ